MKAAQYVAPGCIEVVERPIPVCEPHQLLVRIEYVGLCGSDLALLYHSAPENFPFPPGVSGHECVGVVVASTHPEFQVGVPVLVLPPEVNAFAEYLAVAPRYLIPLPADLDRQAAVLAQQLGTVLFCLHRLDPLLGKRVVIVRQGPIGLLFTLLCYRFGARQVIGIDTIDARLEMSRRLGASYAVNADRSDPVAVVQALTEGKLADVVVEAVGKAETVNLSPELARVGGELALFGIPQVSRFPFNYASFFRKYLRTTTTANAQAEPGLRSFRLALDLISAGRMNVGALISHCLPFDEIGRAFSLAETKADGAVKVLLALG